MTTDPSGFFVEFDATDAVETVLVQPSAPPDAHAVQNEARLDVHLCNNDNNNNISQRRRSKTKTAVQ